MGFSTPLGLLAFLALPAIVFLHLYRRRFRERHVAGLFLFAPDALPSRAGRTRTRLLQTPSLWLELLAALCLALLLAGFHLGAPATREHRVFVLDDSASMAAMRDGESAAERAIRFAQGVIDGLDDDAVVSIVVTGDRPRLLAGPRAPKGVAREALGAYAPGRPGHDVALALALGLDLAAGGAAPIFVTDHEEPTPPPGYRHVGVGRRATNAAIVSARRLRRDEKDRVLVDVACWGEAPLETTLTLEARAGDAAREVGRDTIRIEPGQTLRLSFGVPATEAALAVALGGDALAIDDEALLLAEPPRTVPVCVRLDADTRAALRLDAVIDAVGRARIVEDGAAAGLAFESDADGAPAAAIEVVVDAGGDETDAWVGPYLLERRRVPGGGDGTPLLAGVSLEGVIWSAGRGAIPGLPLVLAGDSVLLAEQDFGGRAVRLRLNLDATRSNLAASPDWPVFVANVLEAARRRLPGPIRTNVTLGEEMVWRAPGAGSPPPGLALLDPDGARRPARGFGEIAWVANRPGLHRLVDDRGTQAVYAARFVDPSESDLTKVASFDVPARARPRAPADGDDRGGREARILALLLLLAIALDWFWLGRRP